MLAYHLCVSTLEHGSRLELPEHHHASEAESSAHESELGNSSEAETATVAEPDESAHCSRPENPAVGTSEYGRNTGANAFAKNQTRLAYEDKRDLYCTSTVTKVVNILLVRPVISHIAGIVVGYWRNGCSYRNIAREVGIHGNTVYGHHQKIP